MYTVKNMVNTVNVVNTERQGSELHMVKKEEGKETQQLTGPEPATSRSIANPLAAEPWPLPATINPFLPSSTSVGVLYPEHPLELLL